MRPFIVLIVTFATLATSAAARVNVGLIAYSDRYYYKGGDSWEVFVMRPDGSGRHRVTPLQPWSDDADPAWSPDGAKISFETINASNKNLRGLFTINVDGTDLRQLTTGNYDHASAWSLAGQIAFVRNDAIWIVNADGGELRKLTSGPSDAGPSWSSDGKRITFARKHDIWVMGADGGNAHRFIRNASSASWSADGRKIAFDRTNGIFVMRVDGTHRHRLGPGGGPRWSPDGRRIAFTGIFRGTLGIYEMDATGRNRHKILTTAPETSDPSWGRGSQ